MNKLRIAGVLTLIFVCSSLIMTVNTHDAVEVAEKEPILNDGYPYILEIEDEPVVVETERILATAPKPELEVLGVVEKKVKKKKQPSISVDDMRLIAHMVMAEAEGESEYGKRLVIDTILNRVDSTYFPDSVHGVIYQPYQFSSIKDGRFDRCYVKDDIYALVEEEVLERTDNNVIFFRTGRYSDYGDPLFKVDHHYFSAY